MHIIHGNPFTIWVPLKPATTIYVGSLVCVDSSALDEGVIVRGQADGAADTTNKDVPLGIVVGTKLPVTSNPRCLNRSTSRMTWP